MYSIPRVNGPAQSVVVDQGPGEFENLSHIYWTDGAIVALDNTHRTLTRFDETGQLIDVPVSPATQTSSLASVGPVAPLSDGYFLGAAVDHVVRDPIIRVRTRLFRIGGVGGDSILDGFSESERVSYGDSPIWIAVPMRPISHYAVHPYGESVVVAHQSIPDRDSQGTFRVRKLDGAGGLLFSRTYNYRPHPVAAGLLDDFLEQMELHRSGLTPREVKRYIEPHMPGFELPITGVAVATDGSIWLRREDYDRQQVRWSVLSERGDPVAQLLLPAGLRVRHITEDALFAVDEDEWGVNYLVKYAIEPGS